MFPWFLKTKGTPADSSKGEEKKTPGARLSSSSSSNAEDADADAADEDFLKKRDGRHQGMCLPKKCTDYVVCVFWKTDKRGKQAVLWRGKKATFPRGAQLLKFKGAAKEKNNPRKEGGQPRVK